LIGRESGKIENADLCSSPFGLASLLSGCVDGEPTAQVVSAPRRDLTPAEKSAISKVVADTLKDPGSANFKWVPLVEDVGQFRIAVEL